ncbi:phosphoribosylglycinamide formyltransferase [Rubripirellula sp.]|jgi:phosphoribosylglycinamide formyltransferase-1|nr:phosphoribosylglycinamide formyltransferase [Planctomycetaceae bacterium]MDA9857082.1 phosphoribosylglycinamide formyltransferase [Rubripirellula sp.]MDF1843406.1 phosphoribosylglycinamide formyltransferase [Rubripirellula sp.]
MNASPLPIAVFLSGGGRSLANLIKHRDEHGLPIEIRLVISTSSKVRGVEIARDAGIETRVVLKSKYPDPSQYTEAMFGPCRECGTQLVVMAGYLKHVVIPDDFDGRVINIHPSLLPSFGGQGMYGHHVHQAAIERGVQISGCTVHSVDNHYDNGPILLQRSCQVKPEDTADSLAARVFELECDALPAAIRQIAAKPRPS